MTPFLWLPSAPAMHTYTYEIKIKSSFKKTNDKL